MGQNFFFLAFYHLFFQIDAYFCRNKICIGGLCQIFGPHTHVNADRITHLRDIMTLKLL